MLQLPAGRPLALQVLHLGLLDAQLPPEGLLVPPLLRQDLNELADARLVLRGQGQQSVRAPAFGRRLPAQHRAFSTALAAAAGAAAPCLPRLGRRRRWRRRSWRRRRSAGRRTRRRASARRQGTATPREPALAAAVAAAAAKAEVPPATAEAPAAAAAAAAAAASAAAAAAAPMRRAAAGCRRAPSAVGQQPPEPSSGQERCWMRLRWQHRALCVP
mmetsp:Transcript_119949/g.384092  ORF Transcript_119949/g.384092 Transcript_119949/m.384092 type:complete len:216 (+) Transcript_119949:163-810(+)